MQLIKHKLQEVKDMEGNTSTPERPRTAGFLRADSSHGFLHIRWGQHRRAGTKFRLECDQDVARHLGQQAKGRLTSEAVIECQNSLELVSK